jgi:hypothetical protein
MAHGMDSKKRITYKRVERLPIKSNGFANPNTGSLFQPPCYANIFSGAKGTWYLIM